MVDYSTGLTNDENRLTKLKKFDWQTVEKKTLDSSLTTCQMSVINDFFSMRKSKGQWFSSF